MTTLATLIAIAAWCGIPSQTYSASLINQCRHEIKACLDKTPKNPACFTDYDLDDAYGLLK